MHGYDNEKHSLIEITIQQSNIGMFNDARTTQNTIQIRSRRKRNREQSPLLLYTVHSVVDLLAMLPILQMNFVIREGLAGSRGI